MPVWRFAVGDLVLEQRIWLEPGANTTYVVYRLLSNGAGRSPLLRVRLLVNSRDHHATTEMAAFQPVIEAPTPSERVIRTAETALRLWVVGGVIEGEVTWFENFDLPLERERGLADRDHHLCVGEAVLPLALGVWTLSLIHI